MPSRVKSSTLEAAMSIQLSISLPGSGICTLRPQGPLQTCITKWHRPSPAALANMKASLLLTLALACVISALQPSADSRQQLMTGVGGEGDDTPWNASVTVDLGARSPVSDVLYGIFFEEIGHAGDGGLYAELVQDRSFDALALVSGFGGGAGGSAGPPPSQQRPQRLPVGLAALAAQHHDGARPLYSSGFRSKADFLRSRQRAGSSSSSSNDIIVAWRGVGSVSTALTREHPLNEHNTVAMSLTSNGLGPGPNGILNTGHWGISLAAGESYHLSLYLLNPEAAPKNVTASLVSEDGATLFATSTFREVAGGWARYTADLLASADTNSAQLLVSFEGPGSLVVDQVSLLPSANVRRGAGSMNPWPFRQDLLDALKGLHPRFLRFPGGCYIEGDFLRNGFYWKNAVGPWEARAGHYNGVWSYWSTDGLGLFEYMQLAEELGAEPIWVINNGISHQESVTGADIMPLVRDALDSLEFISGPADSPWGSLRAAMGHPEPWSIRFMAIGNEGCGLPWDPPVYKPYYLQNYLAFFGAIKAAYPHMRLIASCDMGQDAPTDLWEYHVYTNPQDMFGRRSVFDGRTPQDSHFIFASEYAVTDGGGWGNLIGAVAEAGFMTGLERNSEVVLAAAYAPLFVNANSRPWPTNLIVFDNHRWYGIPSYYVQQLFAEYQGTHYARTDVGGRPPLQAGVAGPEESVAASATCQDEACTTLAVKVVNMAPFQQYVAVQLSGPLAGCVAGEGRLAFLTSADPNDENNLDQPRKVSTQVAAVEGLASSFVLPVSPFSVNVLSITLGNQPCLPAGAAGRVVRIHPPAGAQ